MKKYNIIYADPPWDYGNTKNLNGEFWGMADKHYNVMKFKDICNLPVHNITADDCYLFLWVTSPFLEKGFEVIKSWGFKYATVGFVWIKMLNDMSGIREDGLGKYTISNAEYCLISRRGKYWRNAKNVQQIINILKQCIALSYQELETESSLFVVICREWNCLQEIYVMDGTALAMR